MLSRIWRRHDITLILRLCELGTTETIVQQADEEAYSRSNYAEAMALDCVEGMKTLVKRMELLRSQVGSPE